MKEISQRCFITHQTASGQLKLLREMRYVSATAIGRESYYELSEPLMRICLEVKKHRGEPLRLFVEFLRCWYTKPELESLLEMVPMEAKLDSHYIRQALTLIKEGSDDPRIVSCHRDLERYKAAGDYGKALNVMDELDALEKVTYDNLIQRGRILIELGKYEEAIKVFMHAIKLDEKRSFAWLGLAQSNLELQKYDEALHGFDKFIELGIDSAAIWGLRGICLQGLDQHEQAVQSFSKVIEHDPVDVGGWEFMGRSLLELGRFDEAVKAFAKVYELDNNKHGALFYQFISLVRAGEIEMAREFENQHKAELSENTIYLSAQAVVESSRGNDIEALPYWQQVIDKGDSTALIHLGKVGSLIALHRWDEADTALVEALTCCPEARSPQEFKSNQIIEKLFTIRQDTGFWQQGAHLFVSRFAEYEALSSLAAGLAQSIAQIMQKTVSDQTAEMWRNTWVNAASGHPEMELALRLLDTAIKYRINNDQRLLMDLPIEERKIFEEIIEKAKIKPV